jgi:hypothetical protein
MRKIAKIIVYGPRFEIYVFSVERGVKYQEILDFGRRQEMRVPLNSPPPSAGGVTKCSYVSSLFFSLYILRYSIFSFLKILNKSSYNLIKIHYVAFIYLKFI